MKQQMRLTPNQADAFKAIRSLSGNGQRTVSGIEWRRAYYETTSTIGDNKRMSFLRARHFLLETGVVREVDFWEYALTKPDTKVTNEHEGA